jgi:hypothetical protein
MLVYEVTSRGMECEETALKQSTSPQQTRRSRLNQEYLRGSKHRLQKVRTPQMLTIMKLLPFVGLTHYALNDETGDLCRQLMGTTHAQDVKKLQRMYQVKEPLTV